MNKAKIIVPALLSIAACGAIVAGSTYALFTSESKVNVAVTSGKVDIQAVIDGEITKSHKEANASGTYEEKEGFYSGDAELDDAKQTLTISKMLPMDKVSFKIKLTNNSNVTTKYRTIIGSDGNNALYSNLKVTIDGEEFSGYTAISSYSTLAAQEGDKEINVSVEFADDASNDAQDKSCEIFYKVEAIQGNAAVEDEADSTLSLYTISDLYYYAQEEAADYDWSDENSDPDTVLYGKTMIKLMSDLDMTGNVWTPIKGERRDRTFDGNGHTISNLTITGEKQVGLYAFATGLTIKNLTIENANVTGINAVGAVMGVAICDNFENIKVTNSTITAVTKDNDDGDKAGAIVGRFSSENAPGGESHITGCEVSGCTIKAYRDLGGVAGMAYSYTTCTGTVSGNTIKDTSVIWDDSVDYNGYGKDDTTKATLTIGEAVGRIENAVVENNTATNVTVQK